MLDEGQKKELKRYHRTAVFAAGTLILSIFLYGVVAFLGAASVRDHARLLEHHRTLMYYAAGALVISSILVKRILLAAKQMIPLRGLTVSDIERLAVRRLRALLMSLVLCNAAAVVGLVLYFQGGEITDFYWLGTLGLAGLLLQLPKYREWERWTKENIA